MKSEIEEKLRRKESSLYKEIEADVRSQLTREQAEKDSSLFKSHKDMYSSFDAQYESKFRTMQGTLDEKFEAMVKDFEELMGQSRTKWDDTWSSQLAKMSSKWTEQWAERERDWLEKEQKNALKRAAQDDTNSKHYKRLLDEHMGKVDVMLEEQREADLSILDVRLKELEDSRLQLVHASETVDAQVQRKYGEWVERLKRTYAASLKAVEEATQRNEAAMKTALDNEKAVHAEATKSLQTAHARQLAVVNGTIAEERKSLALQQQQFEESLRIKYQSMVESLHEKVHQEQEAQMRRALDLLEQHARADSERSREKYEIQAAAEAAAAKNFSRLEGDLRETWQKEETERAKQMDQRLRAHYDTVIEHMQAQLDAALKLNDDADRQWMEDVEARNHQQVATMQEFEEKSRRLYETRLAEYIERTDETLRSYEKELQDKTAEATLKESQRQSELKQLRQGNAEWRAQYTKEMDERYRATVVELEARHSTEMESCLQQLEDARSELAVMDDRVQQAHDKSDGEFRKQSEAEKTVRNKKNDVRRQKQSQRESHAALVRVWAGLKTPANEQVETLEKLLATADPTDEMIAEYEKYNSQLSAQLPLIQMATRREYLKFRIKALRRAAGHADAGNNNSASELASLNVSSYQELEQQFAAHMDEFTALDKKLEDAVGAYNAKFGERFRYKGEDYLDTIKADSRAEKTLSDAEQKLHVLEAKSRSPQR